MEITLRELVEGEQALANLAQSKQPVKTAYRIARVLRQAEPELMAFYEARRGLLEKYGVKDGEQYRIEKERIPAFTEELDGLLDERLTIDVAKIDLDSLGGEIRPADLAALGWLVFET